MVRFGSSKKYERESQKGVRYGVAGTLHKIKPQKFRPSFAMACDKAQGDDMIRDGRFGCCRKLWYGITSIISRTEKNT